MTSQATKDMKLRQRAEEAVKNQSCSEYGLSFSDEQLLHELRVSLVELELLKMELRQAQGELVAERARIRDFYDFAPVGYLTVSAEGVIREANATAAALLGLPRDALVHQPISRFIHPGDLGIYYLNGRHHFLGPDPQTYELRMLKFDGSPLWMRMEATALSGAGGEAMSRVVLCDISEYKLKEDEREQIVSLIHLINMPGDLHDHVSALASSLQKYSGCEAVGIRLRSGHYFPYFETVGFPDAFVLGGNSLCLHGPQEDFRKDDPGNPVLECICGTVLSGALDPTSPCCTPNGSFWSNNTGALDGEADSRNDCFGQGYQSIAIVPLRSGDHTFGLLQFNDHRPGRFTPSLIELFEKVADGLALAILHREAEKALSKSEKELVKSQQLLAETGQIGKVGGWEFDTRTGKQTWTDEMFAILEVDKSFEPTVENGVAFYTPASRTVIEPALQRIVHSGEAFDEVLELVSAKGNLLSVHVIGKADPENSRIYGFFQDVTERKRAEAYGEMAREVLKIINEPESMESLIPRVVVALKKGTGMEAVGIRLQQGDDFPYVSQDGFPESFLLAENTLVGRSLDGGICRDQDGNACLECTCGLVISGHNDPMNPLFTEWGSCWTNDSFPLLDIPAELDPRLRPRNECIHQGYASVALVPIRDSDRIVGLIQFNDHRKDCFTLETVGRLEEIAAYLGAVLMRRRLEEDKLALQQQYQDAQKLESLGVLAGGIAHDFNNLLMVILGHCSLAKLDPGIAENSLSGIEKASERAAELCRQMLTYAGKSRSALGLVEMQALVDEMVKMLRSAIKQNVALKLDLSSGTAFIKGDASQLRQIIMNLIINASEAIGEDQGEIRVSLARTEIGAGPPVRDHLGRTIARGLYANLEVSDTGCGMANETARRIFEPFFTTKFAGRGLGLSTTLGIINSHGGALQLFSQTGQGTTIKVLLPIEIKELATDAAVQVVEAPWQGSGSILLVEDDGEIREIARTMLEALGFNVVEASNGSEALETYRSNPKIITLVLTDVGMPVMNGYELFRELKKLDQRLPIIISSGFGDDNITSQISRDAVTGLLTKPYTLDKLRGVLKGVFAQLN